MTCLVNESARMWRICDAAFSIAMPPHSHTQPHTATHCHTLPNDTTVCCTTTSNIEDRDLEMIWKTKRYGLSAQQTSAGPPLSKCQNVVRGCRFGNAGSGIKVPTIQNIRVKYRHHRMQHVTAARRMNHLLENTKNCIYGASVVRSF